MSKHYLVSLNLDMEDVDDPREAAEQASLRMARWIHRAVFQVVDVDTHESYEIDLEESEALPPKPSDDSTDDRPTDTCTCGFPLIYTEGSWEHDAAPWRWGDDHNPNPSPAAQTAAREWDRANADEDPA